MRYSEIIEARRNSEQNPKISVNEYITQAIASAQQLSNTGFKNLFVTFTDLPKLGINPRSRYNTPIGIYAYPAEYVIEKTTQHGDKTSTLTMQYLPFAGDKPWANIFRVKSGTNIINIGKFTEAQYNQYCDKLKVLLTKVPVNQQERIDKPIQQNTLSLEQADKYIDILMNAAKIDSRVKTPGGMFWYVTMRLSEFLGRPNIGNKSVTWTSLFRRIGIDGFVDPDTEVIHSSEPTQAVFFGGSVVDLLATVSNKYSPIKVANRKELGQERHEIFSKNMQYLRTLLKREWSDPYERMMALSNFISSNSSRASSYFKRIDPKTRLDLIEYDANLFRYIYKVATGPEFAAAFVRNPRLIGNIASIKPYVSIDEFKKLLKQIIPNMQSITLSDDVSREIASEIFWVLNNDNLLLRDNELMKLLIDINPRIWSRFYTAFGVDRNDNSIYEYALKIMLIRRYNKSYINDLESVIY